MTQTFVRWGGLAAMMGGALYTLFMFIHPANDPTGMTTALWTPVHVAWLISVLLILLGLVGLYLEHADQMGALGLAAFVVAFCGNALLVAGTFIDAFVLPTLALGLPEALENPPVSLMIALLLTYLLFALGYVLFGIVIMRWGVLSRWAGLLLAVGAPLFLVGVATVQPIAIVGAVLFGAGWMWLGFTMLSGKEALVARAASVR